MKNEIFECMSDKLECIYEFKSACDKMIQSKYILAEKRISQVLQSIAASSKLYAIFKELLSDFDYPSYYNLAVTERSGEFVLPPDIKRALALIFCVLLDFDTGRRDLEAFLDEYFNAAQPNEQYRKFCSAVIIPFSVGVVKLFSSAYIK